MYCVKSAGGVGERTDKNFRCENIFKMCNDIVCCMYPMITIRIQLNCNWLAWGCITIAQIIPGWG